MSGIVKAVGKVFSAIGSVIKKIWKPVLIAAAVYFTAGLALSAMPSTAAFAASMPGFAGGGIAGLGFGSGFVPGTGVLTHLAASIGLGALGSSGGLVGGALAAGTTTSELAAAGISGATIASGGGAALATGHISALALPAEGAGSVAAGSAAATAAGGVAAKGGMTLAEKFLVASTVSNVAGGLNAPSPRDIEEAQKTWVGSFYGVDSGGKGGNIGGAGQPPAPAAQTQQLIPLPSSTTQPAVPGALPQPGALPASTIKKPIPIETQQARQAMTAQPSPSAQTAAQPFDYGKQSLIPTNDAPFEALTPGSVGQLDALQ